MKQRCFRFSTLVALSDALDRAGPDGPAEAFAQAVAIVQGAVGATVAPAYLRDADGQPVVVAPERGHQGAVAPAEAALVVAAQAQPPWANPEGRPVAVADHAGEPAYTDLPAGFRAWCQETAVCLPLQAHGRHLGAVWLAFDQPFALAGEAADFLTAAGHVLGGALWSWQALQRQRELGALAERRLLAADVDRLDAIVGRLQAALRHEAPGLSAAGPEPVPAPAPPSATLTRREHDVVQLVVNGLSNEEIAHKLYLSEATVKKHLGRAMAKWQLKNRVQLAVHGVRQGLAA